MLWLLLACAGGEDDSASFQDTLPSGLDTGEPPIVLLAGEEVTACDWARFEAESVAPDGTRFWLEAELPVEQALGYARDDAGPWEGTGTLDADADIVFSWIDLDHPSGTTLKTRDCSGSPIRVDGSVCYGFNGAFTLRGERTASARCGDDSAWRLTFHATDVEPACIDTALEATELGPFTATIKPARCG